MNGIQKIMNSKSSQCFLLKFSKFYVSSKNSSSLLTNKCVININKKCFSDQWREKSVFKDFKKPSSIHKENTQINSEIIQVFDDCTTVTVLRNATSPNFKVVCSMSRLLYFKFISNRRFDCFLIAGGVLGVLFQIFMPELYPIAYTSLWYLASYAIVAYRILSRPQSQIIYKIQMDIHDNTYIVSYFTYFGLTKTIRVNIKQITLVHERKHLIEISNSEYVELFSLYEMFLSPSEVLPVSLEKLDQRLPPNTHDDFFKLEKKEPNKDLPNKPHKRYNLNLIFALLFSFITYIHLLLVKYLSEKEAKENKKESLEDKDK